MRVELTPGAVPALWAPPTGAEGCPGASITYPGQTPLGPKLRLTCPHRSSRPQDGPGRASLEQTQDMSAGLRRACANCCPEARDDAATAPQGPFQRPSPDNTEPKILLGTSAPRGCGQGRDCSPYIRRPGPASPAGGAHTSPPVVLLRQGPGPVVTSLLRRHARASAAAAPVLWGGPARHW